MTNDEIIKRATKVIVDMLDVEAADIKPEANLIEDLGADSLGLIELLLAMEEEFEIDASDEEADGVGTVQDVFNLIAQNFTGATGARP